MDSLPANMGESIGIAVTGHPTHLQNTGKRLRGRRLDTSSIFDGGGSGHGEGEGESFISHSDALALEAAVNAWLEEALPEGSGESNIMDGMESMPHHHDEHMESTANIEHDMESMAHGDGDHMDAMTHADEDHMESMAGEEHSMESMAHGQGHNEHSMAGGDEGHDMESMAHGSDSSVHSMADGGGWVHPRRPIDQGIYTMSGANTMIDESSDVPYLAPAWQIFPLMGNEGRVMYNEYSDKYRRRAIDTMLATNRPAMTEVLIGFADHHHYYEEPSSVLLYPVHDSFDDKNNHLVGFISVTFSWIGTFWNILPENVRGAIAIIETSSGQKTSFRIDGKFVSEHCRLFGAFVHFLPSFDPFVFLFSRLPS